MLEGLSNNYIHSLATLLGLHKYRGVYPADKIPLGGQGSFIVNTHPANKPGEHFIVLCRLPRRYIYFDPLGLTLDNYPDVKARVTQSKHTKKYRPYLTGPVQSPLSDFCGLFCIVLSIPNVI